LYYCCTQAGQCSPIDLCSVSKLWLGKRGANGVLIEFTKCAAASKLHIAAGGKPTCIIDHWIASIIESNSYRDKVAAGNMNADKPSVYIREFTDSEIAQTIFTLLFASQDASSSATTCLFQIMAQRSDVLDRVRQESLDVRGGNKNATIAPEMSESMTHTNAVVKEVLRYRPPVTFVPYLAKKSFRITPTYTVPKGAMVIPSCYPAHNDPEVYPQPDLFDPRRWISGDAGEKSKNWLVFGMGPHNCLA